MDLEITGSSEKVYAGGKVRKKYPGTHGKERRSCNI